MKQSIVNRLTWLANRMAEGYTYKNWTDEFARQDAGKAFEALYKELPKHIKLDKLTRKEMQELQFGRWDDESELMLVPLWLVPLVPDDIEVYGIGGGKMTAAEAKKDLDVRFGCVAWGIYPKKED